MDSSYSQFAAQSADDEQQSIRPITAITFNKSGSLMAWAVAYDWEKVPTPLFPIVIVVFSRYLRRVVRTWWLVVPFTFVVVDMVRMLQIFAQPVLEENFDVVVPICVGSLFRLVEDPKMVCKAFVFRAN